MNELLAKSVAVTVGLLLLLVVAILFFTSRPSAGARVVTAEFDDAFPLIEGMYVRVDGAIAGTVGEIEVNDRGNAEVDLVLNDSVEQPMADATAALRQQDTTGDSYVAFDPGGDSSEPLGEEGIVCDSFDRCESTLVAPRLDDLLNAFGPAERSGVQLILVELAKALDRRGDDLNRAALRLRPAFESANRALAEVSEQNEALKQLITSAESVTGQAARRDAELQRLIDSLATTTAATAGEADGLDAGLERLPETTARARTTLAALSAAAVAGRPLAEELASGAPRLATSLARLPGFLDNASAFVDDTRPTLELTRKLLRAARPTLRVGKERIVTGPFDLTGATAELLNSVLGGEDAFPALFGDDSYGEGEGTLGKRGFGAVAVEPGNLPGYPESHAPRNWLRISAVLNCEVFGAPVEPGCLADVLESGSPLPTPVAGRRRAQEAADARDAIAGGRPGGGQDGPRGEVPQPPAPSGGGSGKPKAPGPPLPDLPGLELPKLGGGRGVADLLDFLTGDRDG